MYEKALRKIGAGEFFTIEKDVGNFVSVCASIS
jgi:hypothetical protein